MTMQPQDAPDWSGVPSGARLVGHLTLAGATGFVDVVTGPNEGGLLLLFANVSYPLDGFSYVYLQANTAGIIVQVQPIVTLQGFAPSPMAFPVNAAIDTSWRVFVSLNAAAPAGDVYVLAVPSYPLVQIATPGAGLRTAPVMLPSRTPVDGHLFANPGANAQATLTYAGVFGFRWVLDFATFTIFSTAAVAAAQGIVVQDGATNMLASHLSIPAVANSIDRATFGPGLGLAASDGANLVVQFAAAGGANTTERISTTAYQLPSGLFAY